MINFIVALPSEAQPIISSLGLRPNAEVRGIKLYQRDNIQLAVSGVGKTASAMAVGYVAGRAPADTLHLWLNVGIAGHARLPRGSAGMAHLITDQSTGAVFYPSIVFRAPCATYALACHDEPTTNYAGDALCDMESAGFFAAASKFSAVEFVHALKIVSDNSAADIKALDRAAISALIEAKLDLIKRIASGLEELAANHVSHPIPLPGEKLLERWHFTTTQRTQLRDLARRWTLVRVEPDWPWDELESCVTSRDVLLRLRTILDSTAPQLSPPRKS